MNTLGPGLGYVDLNFLGVPRVIATVVMHGSGGVALIDPGPSSTLPALRAALEHAGMTMRDVTTLLITHIHLDHAGATGTLVRENPKLKVYLHENGARHMASPEKLIASATRLYGDDMDRLWGEFLPVAADAMITLHGGETIEAGGRSLQVAYTPGHASHHVSYFAADAGIAFVGDTAGIRLRPGGYVLPPTPPPDIDLELWQDSLARIGAWRPETLFPTHFGPSAPAAPHLAEFADHLASCSRLAQVSLTRDEPDEAKEAWFVEEVRRELRREVGEADARAYEVAGRFDLSWRGLARYWRKRQTDGG
jgi:glyoxylase-like metal-dependent hydrolase (beta-lactamase superfamily II)